MPKLPVLSEGLVLTHFIVSDPIASAGFLNIRVAEYMHTAA